jgi:hypothetical protein
LTPVMEIDGRKILNRSRSQILKKLQEIFRAHVPGLCESS